jgi:amino acid adenylation domain-containing protein
LLACARIGAAFIPIDPDTPDPRVHSIDGMTGPALYLRAAGCPLRQLGSATPTAVFDAGGITLDGVLADRAPSGRRAVVGGDAAYLIFTSGTTGQPKGVVMSHQSALAFYRGAQLFGAVAGADRVASTSPLAFDVSLFDICLTLGTGATLVVVPREFLSFPRRFLGYLRDTRATVVHAVPSIWRPLLRHEPDAVAALDDLRGILFAGEPFPLAELRRLQSLQPRLRIVNAFGATETVACSFADVPNPLPEQAERLSIGHGYPGAELLLLDDDGATVDEPGAIGEIYIRCPSLFTGYWQDPESTRAALVSDPVDPRSGQLVYRSGDLAYRGPHGELYFCGRTDSMVKIRGNRIELGEVERRLGEHPGVAAVAVIAVGAGELTLAAFVVLKDEGAEVRVAELAELCRQSLPSYMVPGLIRFLPELPLTANGKVNRTALTDLAHAAR